MGNLQFKRITASFFGQICKKLPHTSCANIIKAIFYKRFDNHNLQYGRIHEKDAKEQLKKSMVIDVKPCGLFINKNMPYLGATPDGIIGDDGIVEIKCPSSCSQLTPEQAIELKKFPFFHPNSTEINRKHNYFYQIQGQLQITQRACCIFVLWTPLGILAKKICKDDVFWQNSMEPKLKKNLLRLFITRANRSSL